LHERTDIQTDTPTHLFSPTQVSGALLHWSIKMYVGYKQESG